MQKDFVCSLSAVRLCTQNMHGQPKVETGMCNWVCAWFAVLVPPVESQARVRQGRPKLNGHPALWVNQLLDNFMWEGAPVAKLKYHIVLEG
jgi:hypothetical protein